MKIIVVVNYVKIVNTIGIYTSELAIWLYLSSIGCQNDKRFKIIPIEIK